MSSDDVLQFPIARRLMTEMRAALKSGDLKRICELNAQMFPEESGSGTPATPSAPDDGIVHLQMEPICNHPDCLIAAQAYAAAAVEREREETIAEIKEILRRLGGAAPPAAHIDPRINMLYNLAHGWLLDSQISVGQCAAELRGILGIDIHARRPRPRG